MFRFTIRDVLWLTLVVGAVLAGAIAYGTIRAENRRLQTIIESQELTIEQLIRSVQLLQK